MIEKRFADAIAKRIKDGYGQGEGESYTAWLSAERSKSKGRTHRVKGGIHDRKHNLLSDAEREAMATLVTFEEVIELQEQKPLLPVELPMAIAEELGINYPTDRETGRPYVMTTDFFITVRRQRRNHYVAISIKYASDLSVDARRMYELFEIERLYWKVQRFRKAQWFLVTNLELNSPYTENACILLQKETLTGFGLSQETQQKITDWLLDRVKRQDTPLRQITAECDLKMEQAQGTSLRVAFHLMRIRELAIDMNVKIDPAKILKLI